MIFRTYRNPIRFLYKGVYVLAITKLMHMKEAVGVPHRHLANAIQYILDEKNNEEKTEHGLYVGGNSGYDSGEILKTFLDTKELFGKKNGRQGYHFVISFAPGEVTADEAYQITREFCEKYLGDSYDHVFAVHTDKKHMHAHIIFNSVNRIDGYKYRYEKGDWKKYIQPITDQICIQHGISPLKFEEDKKIGVSYASWNEKKNKKIGWTRIIQADVDWAVNHSDTLPEFIDQMNRLGYQVKAGKSKKKNITYLTYIYTDDDGKQHRRRSYNMPQGYSPEDIAKRIKQKSGSRMYEEIADFLEKKHTSIPVEIVKNTGTYRRMYQAVSYYRLPNPYAVRSGVRKDIINIDRLIDEVKYIRDNALTSKNAIEEREARLESQIEVLTRKKWNIKDSQESLSDEQIRLLDRKRELENELLQNPDDDKFEKLQDELEEVMTLIPEEIASDEDAVMVSDRIKDLKRELRMVKRIKENETSKENLKEKDKEKNAKWKITN